jgi:thiol-disulfide isomerase/thioredoxin
MRHFPIVLIIGAFILSACGTATPTADAMVEKPTAVMTEEHADDMQESPTEVTEETSHDSTPDEMMEDDKEGSEATPDPTDDGDTAEVMTPDWFSATLVDVNTNEQFKIEDFKGKVVLLENIAMWCTTCRNQQRQVLELHNQLGDREDFVSVVLDIDPNEIAGDLRGYTQNNGFYWTYAISPPIVSNEIAQLYGNQFLNPPSAPMFIIDHEGQVHPLRFGVKSAEELLEELQPYFDAAM